MRLLIQPGDGVKPLIEAIDEAREKVEIAIFRFDRNEVEKALVRAVERGVFVHALIAYTNRGGEKNLRQLEMRLLEKGVTVARTANDLVRYHGKYMIVDGKTLHLLAFNFTYLDMEHSRSFGLITRNAKLVEEAGKLFEADFKRQPYQPSHSNFVVSPLNARKELTAFLEGAKKKLLIYDPKLGDPKVVRLLEEKMKAGVEVRVIGCMTRKSRLEWRELEPIRLHTRSIVRDGEGVFVGSQSLRATELETRREVGVIFDDEKIADRIAQVFEDDWKQSAGGAQRNAGAPLPVKKTVRRVAKALTRDLPAVAPVLEVAVREVVGGAPLELLDAERLEETVRSAVREAVEDSVREAVEEIASQKQQ